MLSIIVSLISMTLAVFTITNLFNWFVAATFHITELSYAAAFGFGLVVGYFNKGTAFIASKTDKYTPLEFALFNFICNVILLTVGYIVKTFFI